MPAVPPPGAITSRPTPRQEPTAPLSTEISPTWPDRYAGYLYAYPHKSAYRRLTPARDLATVWADEPSSALFLYTHVPFCEMRCGFCNLFTQSRPTGEVVERWLDAWRLQAQVWSDAILPGRHIARMALGGGTPTVLDADQLGRLFDTLGECFGARPDELPTSVEVSPHTADLERLSVLADRGVERVSIGVESLDVDDLRALGRPQRVPEVHEALGRIRSLDIPMLNVDLIYGAVGQTEASWRRTLAGALEWAPEEIYAYPLYVRPLTGLGRREGSDSDRSAGSDPRYRMYDIACEVLGEAGYEQVSMRMFRRLGAGGTGPTDVSPHDLDDQWSDDTSYDCQDDGMVGLGCGARSYTQGLHHSHDYAVSRTEVAGIVERYSALDAAGHRRVDHGVELDPYEQRRRFAIKGALRRPGLDTHAYRARFGTEAFDDLPVLADAVDEGWLRADGRYLAPTDAGLGWSDSLGSALVSPDVRARMEASDLR